MAGYIPYDQSTGYSKKKDEKQQLPPPGGAFRGTGGDNLAQSSGAVDTYKGLLSPERAPGAAPTAGGYLVGVGRNVADYFDETSRRFGSRGPGSYDLKRPLAPATADPETADAATAGETKPDETKSGDAGKQKDTGETTQAAAGDPAAEPSLPGAYRIGTNAFVTGEGNEFGDAKYLASRGIAVPAGGVDGEADKTSSLSQGSVSYGREGDSAYALDQYRKALAIRKQMAGNDPRSKAERLLSRLPYGEIGDRRKRESMLAAAGLYLGADETDKTAQAALLGAQADAQNQERQTMLDTIEASKPELQTLKDENGNEVLVQIGPDGSRQVFNPAAYDERRAMLEEALEKEDISPEEYQQKLAQLNQLYGR